VTSTISILSAISIALCSLNRLYSNGNISTISFLVSVSDFVVPCADDIFFVSSSIVVVVVLELLVDDRDLVNALIGVRRTRLLCKIRFSPCTENEDDDIISIIYIVIQ
jgi:hypothetical protein